MGSIQNWGAAAGIAAVILPILWGVVKILKSRFRRRKLEKYLQDARNKPGSRGRHTIAHLVARLHLTEDEIITAAASSKHIRSRIISNRETGLADGHYYEYVD